MNEIMRIAKSINVAKLKDGELPRILDFMKELPALEGKFQDLKR